MSIILSFTVYMWVGVAGALRRLTTEVQKVGIKTQNANSTLDTIITIDNPSDFALWVSYVALKGFQVNGARYEFSMERDPRSFYSFDPPIEVRGRSEVTINFSIPTTVDSWLSGEDKEWKIHIRIYIRTVFTGVSGIRLDVERSYIQRSLAFESLGFRMLEMPR